MKWVEGKTGSRPALNVAAAFSLATSPISAGASVDSSAVAGWRGGGVAKTRFEVTENRVTHEIFKNISYHKYARTN